MSIYPIVTWQVTVPNSVLYVRANNISEPLTVAGNDSDYWGFGAVGDTDTIAGLMETALETHSEISAATVSHPVANNGHPALRWLIGKNGDNAADEIEWTNGSTTTDGETTK